MTPMISPPFSIDMDTVRQGRPEMAEAAALASESFSSQKKWPLSPW